MENYYSIIILEPPPEKAKIILARKLAATPEISLDEAASFLDSVPFTYQRNIPEKDMRREVLWLKNLGVKFRVSIDEKPVSPKKQKRSFSTPGRFERGGRNIEGKNSSGGQAKKRIQQETLPENGPLILNTGKSEKKNRMGYIKGILVFTLLFLLFVFLYKWQRNSTPPSLPENGSFSPAPVTGRKKNSRPVSKSKAGRPSERKQKYAAAGSSTRISENYADSARKFAPTPEEAIRFYRMAISFNRNNINAWIGLLNALKDAGMTSEAVKTKKEMEAVFGSEALNLKDFIKQYGELMNYSIGRDGVCRIRYESSTGNRKKLYRDTYSILKFIKSKKDFSRASIFSETGRGTGMLVNVKGDPFPSTFSEYKKSASVDVID